MVLLEIDADSVSRVEFEGDAPRSVDMNRVAGWNEAFQCVKIQPREVHLLRRRRGVQPVEADQDAFVHLDVDLGRAAFRPQVGEGLASERPDHGAM